MIWGPSRSPNHLTVDSTIAPGTQERNAYPNNKCRGLQLILLIDDHHHSWNSKKKKKKKMVFFILSTHHWTTTASCGDSRVWRERDEASLKPFGSRLDGWGKFIRQKTMAMMMMMMMMTVCPAHKKPSFILFSTFILCCILVPSVSFVVFFFVFIWLRDKHYVRALNRLWVAQKWFKIFFVLFFYF